MLLCETMPEAQQVTDLALVVLGNEAYGRLNCNYTELCFALTAVPLRTPTVPLRTPAAP
jgi:hypothetical protein